MKKPIPIIFLSLLMFIVCTAGYLYRNRIVEDRKNKNVIFFEDKFFEKINKDNFLVRYSDFLNTLNKENLKRFRCENVSPMQLRGYANYKSAYEFYEYKIKKSPFSKTFFDERREVISRFNEFEFEKIFGPLKDDYLRYVEYNLNNDQEFYILIKCLRKYEHSVS